jgi:hypothetical protein
MRSAFPLVRAAAAAVVVPSVCARASACFRHCNCVAGMQKFWGSSAACAPAQQALQELQAAHQEQIVDRVTAVATFPPRGAQPLLSVAVQMRAGAKGGARRACAVSGVRLMAEWRASVSYDWVVRYAPTSAPRLRGYA